MKSMQSNHENFDNILQAYLGDLHKQACSLKQAHSYKLAIVYDNLKGNHHDSKLLAWCNCMEQAYSWEQAIWLGAYT